MNRFFKQKYFYTTFLGLIIAISFLVFTFHRQKIDYTPADTLKFTRIAEVLSSPDGQKTAVIAYNVIKSDDNEKIWEASLHWADNQGTVEKILSSTSLSNLNWYSSGDKIAYLSPGNKNNAIWMYDFKANQSQILFEFERDIMGFKLSPNDLFTLFIAESNIEDHTVQNIPLDVEKLHSNIILYLLDNTKTGSKAVALSSKDVSISTGMNSGFSWSPDSKMVAFDYQPSRGAKYRDKSKIKLLELETQLSWDIPFTLNHTGIHPLFSPNGTKVAFKSNPDVFQNATLLNNDINLSGRICVFNPQSNTTECLQNTFNENPEPIGWSSDSSAVFVLDAYKTLGYLIYRLDTDPMVAPLLISNIEGFIQPYVVTINASNNLFGFGYETSQDPPEAYTADLETFTLKRISNFNHRHKPRLGSIEEISWHSNNYTIDGLLIKPANYQPGSAYPLLVMVHGGPAGEWAKRYLGGCDEYGTMIDPSSCTGNFLSQGFIIFQPNPRGSSGYGRAFRFANFGDFGGADYRDIMSGVDMLIQKGIADPNHMAILGWSFGGYMTAWAISQTNQFKAAVAGDANTNFISFTGTSDIPAYYEKYMGKKFYEDLPLYLERSPISHSHKINTPLLIISGEKDIRVPITQSYELYEALKNDSKPVKMLVLPGEGHVPTNANIIYETLKESIRPLNNTLPLI